MSALLTPGIAPCPFCANTGLGRLDVALDRAATTQWTVVDMKRDWKVIFPFQKR
jgi:hypothetical protein